MADTLNPPVALDNITLACIEAGYCAVRILDKQAVHPEWRENDAWETADVARAAIKEEFPDVQFLNRIDFQIAYAKRRYAKESGTNASHGPIRWPIAQLEQPYDAFTNWFDQFLADGYTDDFRCPDEFEQHGFPRPDREPDGVWDSGESEDYPTGTTRISFWREGEEMLAFSEVEDPVMSLDHYHWYRIPVRDLFARMWNESMKSQAKQKPLELQKEDEESILAFLCPDNCPGIEFPVNRWLREADERAIGGMRELSYGGTYLCDGVAQDMRAYDEKVSAVMAYCDVIDLGFTCAVPIQKTEAWITAYRPHLIHPTPNAQPEG